MMRRCSVMRMPLATHCASMKFGLVLGHDNTRRCPASASWPAPMRVHYQARSRRSTSAAWRALALALRVVARPAADLAKSRAGVELARRLVILVHFEEHGAHAEPGEAAQMQVEQPARQPAPAPGARHRDGENLRLVGGAARHDEADAAASARRAIRDHVAVGQQLLEFLLAPAAIERGRMQRGERGRVARMRVASAGSARPNKRASKPLIGAAAARRPAAARRAGADRAASAARPPRCAAAPRRATQPMSGAACASTSGDRRAARPVRRDQRRRRSR